MPCSPRTDAQTDTKVTTVGTLSGFQDFFLRPIIKDRPKKTTTQNNNNTHEVATCEQIDIRTHENCNKIEKIDDVSSGFVRGLIPSFDEQGPAL